MNITVIPNTPLPDPEREGSFLSEVERRAGATREDVLNSLLYSTSKVRLADLLRRILGEKP